MHRMRRLIAWLGGVDLAVLLMVLAMALTTWTFVAVANRVTAGSTQEFDERLILLLRNPSDPADPIGPEWMEETGRDLTALGGVAALFLMTTAVSGYLLICRKLHALALLIAATAGGLLLSTLLKDLFHRPRPELVPHLSYVSTSSFPSGHSMLSAVVYLTLGSLLARLVQRRALKVYVLGVAILLSFLVGVSRLYLGVHYPTDVLAGWSAGLFWALLCNLVARVLQRRNAIEKSIN